MEDLATKEMLEQSLSRIAIALDKLFEGKADKQVVMSGPCLVVVVVVLPRYESLVPNKSGQLVFSDRPCS